MDSLTIVEQFDSICGEGTEIGLKAHFVRLAGCSLRCPGWPCDTPYSWDAAKFKGEWQTVSVSQLANALAPYPRIFITGGEPLLQTEALEDLLIMYKSEPPPTPPREVILQTNGTLKPTEALLAYCDRVSVDFKTPSSKEKSSEEAIALILKDRKVARATVQIKFLLVDEEDYAFSQAAARWAYEINPDADIVLGCANRNVDRALGVGDLNFLLREQRRWVGRFLEESWPPTARFLPQFHVYLWGNRRGV